MLIGTAEENDMIDAQVDDMVYQFDADTPWKEEHKAWKHEGVKVW